MSVELRSPGKSFSSMSTSPLSREGGYRPTHSISKVGNINELSSNKFHNLRNSSEWKTLYKNNQKSKNTLPAAPKFKRTFDTRNFQKLEISKNPFSQDRTVDSKVLKEKQLNIYKRPDIRILPVNQRSEIIRRPVQKIEQPKTLPQLNFERFKQPRPQPDGLRKAIEHPRQLQKTESKSPWIKAQHSRVEMKRLPSIVQGKVDGTRPKNNDASLYLSMMQKKHESKLPQQLSVVNKEKLFKIVQNGRVTHSEQRTRAIPEIKINIPQKQLELRLKHETPIVKNAQKLKEIQNIKSQAAITLTKYRQLNIPQAEMKVQKIVNDTLQQRGLLSLDISQKLERAKKSKESSQTLVKAKTLQLEPRIKTLSPKIKKFVIVLERDRATDNNRIQATINAGMHLLSKNRRDGVSGYSIASSLPSAPGEKLSSRIRHQLRLPLHSEAQYDEYKNRFRSNLSKASSIREIQTAAKLATDQAPAVKLTLHEAKEKVSSLDEQRAKSGGISSGIIYQKAA